MAWFVIDATVAAEVAGVVKDDGLRRGGFWQARLVAGEELGVVLDFRRSAEFFPVFLDGADAVGADGDDFLHLVLLEGFEIGLGEHLEDEVVAESAGGVSGAFFLAEDAVACAEIVHDIDEAGDDFAAFGVVSAHAAEPEAVFL